MSRDDVEHALAIEGEIQQFIWNVKPLLSAGRDEEAARLALLLRHEFAERGESYAAASMSSMAATFLARAGDRAASIEAARLATSLHSDPEFRIDHATRLMRNGDSATARLVLNEVLETQELPANAQHRAFAAMAKILAADGQYEQACTLLAKSCQVAVERSLPSTSWNVGVVRDLVEEKVCTGEVHAYLTALLDRARSDGAQFLADDVQRLIERSSSGSL